MKLNDVPVSVAIQRLYLWGDMSLTEKDTMAHSIKSGWARTYVARDTCGEFVGHTRIEPQDSDPVTLVTEITF